MNARVDVLLPIGEALDVPGNSKPQLAPRLDSLAGKTIAVFSNSWQCMVTIADELQRILPAQYGVKEVLKFDSPLTLPMPEESVRAAVARCDAAIVGMGT